MKLKEDLEKCIMCPHKCGVNRYKNVGFCKAESNIKIGLVSTHEFEEPCISYKNGSGTIFFSNCNLRCKFCQNYKISHEGKGKIVSIEELANIMLNQQEKGVNNINLVTPTIYAIQIKQAIILAKEKGLKIPIIYNCGGYESVDTLKELDGLIDVYLPDFKYFDDEIARKYSGVTNYFKNASIAIKEMLRQVGNPKFTDDGIIKSGVIIRHLILPNNTKNTKKILDYIKEEFGTDVYISIMAQYFPTYKANECGNIDRKINKKELKLIENYIYELGFENGFIQKLGKDEEKYVPKF